jgi:hypothetical protein
LLETFPAPFTAQRERCDEEGENDAHSIEIIFANSNEVYDHQNARDRNQRRSNIKQIREALQLPVSDRTAIDYPADGLRVEDLLSRNERGFFESPSGFQERGCDLR